MERRSHDRAPSSVTVRCRVPASPVQVTIQNISIDGCLIDLGRWRVQSGTTVLFEVSPDVHVMGRIIWRNGGIAGVKFDTDFPADLLAAIVEGKAAPLEGNYTLRPEDAAVYYEPTTTPRWRSHARN